VLAGHLAIADLKEGRFVYTDKVRRLDGGLAFAREDGLHVALESWELRLEANGDLRVKGRGDPKGPMMDLTVRPMKPLVKQGVDGCSVKGKEPGNASAYVSWTRLAVSGELGLDGRSFRVQGQGWFDHEWGTSQLGAEVTGWDWLGLRLDDGRELMIYGLRQADRKYTEASGGTLVAADGRSRRLTSSDVVVEPSGAWRSPATRGEYPRQFRIRIPSESLDVIAAARLDGCELDTRRTTGVVYWEGPVQVKPTAGGAPVGRGYMELTGYAEPLAGRL
jgi:predicted secreted hydrolase